MKQISTKQAEKWLEKLRIDNPNGFKEMNKVLKKYQKFDDSYDCYLKTSNILLQSPGLAKDINPYLEQGNKFIINESEEEKLTRLVHYISQYRVDKFRQILTLVEGFIYKKNTTQMTPEQQNVKFIALIKNFVKGDPQLQQITERALLSGDQLISNLDLEHLKINRLHQIVQQVEEIQQDENSKLTQKKIVIKKPPVIKQKEIVPPLFEEKSRQAPKIAKPLPNSVPITINEEVKILRNLEKFIGIEKFDYVVKIIHIYSLCIITRNQCLSLIDFIHTEEELQHLKDIIQSRQNDRRRLGGFRPLNDNDYSITERASPSYVTVPSSYPIYCSNRNIQLKEILNEQWVSVPYGSEQYFNVRNKNMFQITLLKSQDQRYQFDLYTNRLKKAIKLFDKIIQSYLTDEQQINHDDTICTIIQMGVLQTVYKNANRQQRQQLEWNLKSNRFQTCKLFRERINFQLQQLKNIKEIHANKNWIDIANKNWIKSLDLKSFQFKKGEKQKMKGASFISQLNDRMKILEQRAKTKLFSSPFQEKKTFPSILNSFESSSKIQRCLNRKLPPIKEYLLEQYKNKTVLPVMIFAFQDKAICNKIYSLILFFIDTSLSNEVDRIKCKTFMEQFLVKFLGWNYPQRRCLSSEYNQDKFHSKIVGLLSAEQSSKLDFNQWIYTEKQNKYIYDEKDDKPPHFELNTLQNTYSLGFEPPKEKYCKILYTTQNFYIFLRFLYALYERYVKLQEVAETTEKILLFDILFFSCIKTKETLKFQQNLNFMFGRQSYLFSTIYKLFENVAKSLITASTCSMTAESFKYSRKIVAEEIYFIMINRYCLENGLHNQRIIRLNYYPNTSVLYMNSLYSYYKAEQTLRDQSKKLIQISKNIEYYTLESNKIQEKKRDRPAVYQGNEIQYYFDSNNYKMTTIGQKQDLILQANSSLTLNKTLRKELKRISKLNEKLGD